LYLDVHDAVGMKPLSLVQLSPRIASCVLAIQQEIQPCTEGASDAQASCVGTLKNVYEGERFGISLSVIHLWNQSSVCCQLN
jgi:hypothetical protein